MSRRPVTLCLPAVLATAVVLLLGAAPGADAAKVKPKHKPRAPVAVGIADQKVAMFADPRFTTGLGIRKVRRVVPWDAMSVDFEVLEVDEWIAAARAANARPLISFGHSRRAGKRRIAPTVPQYLAAFRAFRKRYPDVTEFATWNEPNLCGEPLCHKAALAARYFDAISAECRTCTILGAEVLDGPTMTSWVKAFLRQVKKPPKVWGLHNYVDANRLKTSGTTKLLKLVKGQVWFTETGGIVFRRASKNKLPGFPETVAHAAVAMRWIFDRLVPLSPRITRVYLYHWNPGGPDDSWDSALIGPDDKVRTAYRVIKARLMKFDTVRREIAARQAAATLARRR